MQSIPLIDQLPLSLVLLLTVALTVGGGELGYRLGRRRRGGAAGEKPDPVGTVVGSTLALLAFILAFTFGMAGNRYDDRRHAVLDEANSIGTTYLRAELLPPAHAGEVRRLLREYVDVRLQAIHDPASLARGIERSQEIQRALWAEVVAVAAEYPPSVYNSLFVQSLNEMFDLHERRIAAGLYSRVPSTVWLALYAVAVIAMLTMGYHVGLSGSPRTVAFLFLTFAFSAVLLLIVDLDRPRSGLVRTSQQTMLDLQASMRDGPP